MERLYADALELGGAAQTALEVKTHSRMSKVQVHDLTIGFPCQDVSTLNNNRCATTVRDASKRTGAVFTAMCEF
eukprot:178428-Alexandrium_andersonii.AAC.1